MKLSLRVIAAVALCAGTATAFSIAMNGNNVPKSSSTAAIERRGFLNSAAATTSSVIIGNAVLPQAAIADDTDPYADFTTTESGLKYKVTKEGDGAIPAAGQTVKAHYTGWLDGFDSIRKFDSSRDRGRPFSFKVAAGQVIRGWDESFASMKVGERRQVIIPPRLGYGDRGAGGVIPGGATLYFDVELLAIL